MDTQKEPKRCPLLPIAREARLRGLRGCEQGATVERSETGERAMFAPAGRITARAGLRSKLAALVVRRQALAPKNPKAEGQLCWLSAIVLADKRARPG